MQTFILKAKTEYITNPSKCRKYNLFLLFLCFVLLSCIFCVYVLVSSDGSQYSSVPDGMFRKPSEGQSLISYLSEQDFGSCADLEKVRAWSILTHYDSSHKFNQTLIIYTFHTTWRSSKCFTYANLI